jgi:peptidyl-prolyl cis-trans isomerase-like 1
LRGLTGTGYQDFMIQGGDPTGTGRGGESVYGCVCLALILSLLYGGCSVRSDDWVWGTSVSECSGKFEDEITKELKHTGAGVLSMVRF